MKKRTMLGRYGPFVVGVFCLVSRVVAGPPVPATDEEIKAMIAKAGDAQTYDNAAYVYVLDEADVYVQESGLALTESCQVIKILTDAGIRAHARLRNEFDPATNRVNYKRVRIHRKDGTVEEVPLSGTITQPAPQHAIYWGNQQHVLSLPRLEIGDSLEVRISKIGYNIAYLNDADNSPASPQAGGDSDSASPQAGGSSAGPTAGIAADPSARLQEAENELQPPMPGHWYESTEFQGDYPIIRKRYSVHMPKDKPVQYEVYNGSLRSSLWFGEKAHVYTWWAEDVSPLKREPFMTSTSDVVPKLVMATIPDWETKSRWFHGVNEGQFEADDAIRAKVAEITNGLDGEEEKIVACLHWVADNIRYFGTSRGPCEGFTLHKGTETFRDRGGVCKDIAGMLITVLRVLGHEVYPALTMAGARVEEIPADQFNHTITVMRNKDGTFRILDPTWAPMSRETWSTWEARQHLVYGTPEGQPLTLSPYFPPEYSTLHGTSTSTLTEDGALETQIVLDMSASPGTSFRRTVGRMPSPDRRALFEGALAVAPNARLEDFRYTDPLDYSQDAKAEMTVSAESYAMGGGDVRLFKLPLMCRPLGGFVLSDLNYPLSDATRKLGLRLRATRRVIYEETLKLPAGWKVQHVPEAQKMDSGSASLTFEATPKDGELSYRFELIIRNNIIPAEDYEGYKKAIDAMNKIRDDWIVCGIG